MHFKALILMVIAIASTALRLPKDRNDWGGRNVRGDCCMVWDMVNNRCIQGANGWNVDGMVVCPSMLEPPTSGFPKDCFIWSMRENVCKEKDDGMLDGLNYTPAQEQNVWLQKWWKFIDKIYDGRVDKVGKPKTEPKDKWEAVISALPPPPKPTRMTWAVTTKTPTHPYIAKTPYPSAVKHWPGAHGIGGI